MTWFRKFALNPRNQSTKDASARTMARFTTLKVLTIPISIPTLLKPSSRSPFSTTSTSMTCPDAQKVDGMQICWVESAVVGWAHEAAGSSLRPAGLKPLWKGRNPERGHSTIPSVSLLDQPSSPRSQVTISSNLSAITIGHDNQEEFSHEVCLIVTFEMHPICHHSDSSKQSSQTRSRATTPFRCSALAK